ncbi:zinc finger protein [Engraulis encrasicolus]|uniref:zinc finger protein n=1 Tax=Engraulis encrasicolus TaxID=184585 RepID=UPI002FD72768
MFSDSYCSICNAQLISDSQRIAHYESKKHANKVRLFHMLHPEDGGPPSKRLRLDNAESDSQVDVNKCCTLCNMFFTSAVVAQSHYQGKTHIKRLRLTNTELTPPPSQTPPAVTPPPQGECVAVETTVPDLNASHGRGGVAKGCFLCGAWFNNPLMAQQHYEGKKHRRNAGRLTLLEKLAHTLGHTHTTGVRSTFSCGVCKVALNSIEQYHAHLQGSKHHNNLKQSQG